MAADSIHGEISWNENLEAYFKGTGEKAHGLAWIHKKGEEIYSSRKAWIDLPVIVMSSVVGFCSVGIGEFGGGQHREEDERLGVGIVGGVHGARRDVRHLTGTEDAIVVADPLFGAAVEHVDDFLAVRVVVKRVAVQRVHVRAHEEEFLGGDEVGAAEPLVVGPGVGFAEGVGDLDEAAVGGGHGGERRMRHAKVTEVAKERAILRDLGALSVRRVCVSGL